MTQIKETFTIQTQNIQFTASKGLRTFASSLIFIGIVLVALQFFFVWHGSHEGQEGNKTHLEEKTSHTKKTHNESNSQNKFHEKSQTNNKNENTSQNDTKGSNFFSSLKNSNPRFFLSIHLAFMLAIALFLGAFYFVAFNHLVSSTWSISIRRLAETHVYFIPIVFALMLVVFLGTEDIFHHWVNAKPDDSILQHKSPWLNVSSFINRNFLFLIVWSVFAIIFWKKSTQQDQATQDVKVSLVASLRKYSAIFLVLFGLTYSMHSWDLGMSLEPHWFSTLWAVYMFSGLALTIFASFILWVSYLKKKGYYDSNLLNENHLHDLSKYLWGHTIFWAYIAVSQYMLIWYAAIPEETEFFKIRNEGQWLYVSLILVGLRFVLPFFLLLKRSTKRNFKHMSIIAVIVIIGQIVDLYWISYPTLEHNRAFVMFSWQELGPIILVLGTYIYAISYGLSKNYLVPIGEPKLKKCMEFEQ